MAPTVIPIHGVHAAGRLHLDAADIAAQLRADADALLARAQQYGSAGAGLRAVRDMGGAEQLTRVADHLDLALIEHTGCTLHCCAHIEETTS